MSKFLEDQYDVIIIGAGIGGLTCGCYLAKAGMNVLIVEQHNKPGGCCTSFKRKEINFDAAVHSLASCRENGLLGQVLDELDLRNKIKFKRMDPTDIIIFKDYEIPIKLNFAETIDIYCNKFPKEAQNIRNFFKDIKLCKRSEYRDYLKFSHKRFTDILSNYFKNKDLISILGILLLNTGIPSCEVSAFVAFFAYKEFLDGGYYPINGMQDFSDIFANEFINYGGTLLLSTRIEKIGIRDKKVQEVSIKGKECIRAKNIISNCDARETYFSLIGVNYLSKRFIKRINGLTPTSSFFTVYLGLNRLISGDKKNGILWYFPNHIADKVFLDVFYNKEPYLKEGLICSFNPNSSYLLEKNISEIMYISVIADYKDYKYWQKNKKRIADKLIHRAEEIFPGISSCIAQKSISTPHDIERYTLNYRGATNGWACIPNQVSFPVIKKNIPTIKGLYLVGHWVNQSFGGGVPTVANAGKRLAKLITN